MSSPTIYFVTGANRGIGLALVEDIASKVQDAFIYVGARNPAKASDLQQLALTYPGKIQIVKYVSADAAGNKAIADTIQAQHGRVDVVIANAGIAAYMGPASETPAEEFRNHFETNIIGVVMLFQAMLNLLKASSNPKFIPITSGAGSIATFAPAPFGFGVYGASKAALNYIARKIHFENDWLTSFPLAPGIIKTDMAATTRALDKTGTLGEVMDEKAISPEEGAAAIMKLIHEATREKDGGEFINVDGTKLAW